MRKTCYTVYEKNPKGGLRYADEAIYDDGNIARPAGDRACAAALRAGRAGRLSRPRRCTGLGASAFNAAACARIFEVKRRPADKPLLCHLFSLEQAEEIAYLTDEARALLRRYTPGPLTLVLKKKPCVPDVVSAGGDTVGLRFPANPVCRAFLRACGCPVAAPSANLSSQPSPVTASPVIDAFYGAIDAVLDGGKTAIGTPSTILSLAGERPELIRAGALPESELKALLGL